MEFPRGPLKYVLGPAYTVLKHKVTMAQQVMDSEKNFASFLGLLTSALIPSISPVLWGYSEFPVLLLPPILSSCFGIMGSQGRTYTALFKTTES